LKIWLPRFWIALVAASVGWLLWKYPGDLDFSLLTEISWTSYAASLMLILIGKFLTIRLLVSTLKSVKYEKSWPFAWWAYSVADLSKYLPGGIWGIAGRIYLYVEKGIPVFAASRAFLAESILIVAFSFCVGMSMFIFSGKFLAGFSPWFVIVFLAASSYAAVHLFMRGLSTSEKLLCWLEQSIAWLCFGSSFALLCATFFPGQNMLGLAGVFNLAFTAGFFAFFAPSGIGVREAVMGYWAHLATLDMLVILKLTIIHRGIWAISDIVMFLSVWAYRSGLTKTVP